MSQESTPLAFADEGEGWHLRRRGLWWLWLLSGLAAVGCLAGAWLAATAGRTAVAAFLLLPATALALLPWGRRSSTAVAARLVDAPEGRALLLPLRPASVPYLVALVCLTLAPLLLPFLATSLLTLRPTDRPAVIAVGLGAAVCAGAAAVAGTALYGAVRSRLDSDRGVVLLPDVVVLRTQRVSVWFPWSAVQDVRAHWTRARGHSDALSTPDGLVQNWFTFVCDPDEVQGPAPWAGASRQPHPTFDATLVGLEPDVALDVCRHYASHPESRRELGGEASLQRTVGLAPG